MTATHAPLSLVEAATGTRHAMVAAPVAIPGAAAQVAGVHHASVAVDGDATRSAGGGVARVPELARTAAVAEALERWAASVATLRLCRASVISADARVGMSEWSLHSAAQRADPEFPYGSAYRDDEWLTPAFDLATNDARWVPAALVSLTDDFGALATSSGLAADPSVIKALLRASQELVERDAYVTTWLHQLGGRQVAVPELEEEVAPLGGRVQAFDCTQDFSPHAVALVAGTLPLAGSPRHTMGVACRSSWEEAVERAYLEMLQGTEYIGHTLAARPELLGLPSERVTGFDEHALYYAANPARWGDVPLLRHAAPAAAPTADAPEPEPQAQLHQLVSSLRDAGVRLYYRELTTEDCNQVGLRVVRVLSPQLAPLHHNHLWPFLGGRTADVTWRYADAPARRGDRSFPSPHPHALG